jgi:hypothetical protein
MAVQDTVTDESNYAVALCSREQQAPGNECERKHMARLTTRFAQPRRMTSFQTAIFGRTGALKCKKCVNRQRTVVNYFWQIVAVEIYKIYSKRKNYLQKNTAFSA